MTLQPSAALRLASSGSSRGRQTSVRCAQSPGSDNSASLRKEAEMPLSHLVLLPRVLEPLPGVFADRLEHPVAPPRFRGGKAQEALLNKQLQGVEVGRTELLGCLERAAAGEDREAPKERLLVGGQELVAPLDRRVERLLTGIGVAAALQEVESPRKALRDLGDAERPRARGCQLDRKRKPVEAGAELGDLFVRGEPATSAEEVDGFLGSKWGDRVLDFSGDAEEFARGAEERHVAAGPQETAE